MSASRLPDRRHSASTPCPVCGGHDGSKRGQGERCHGFISGEWVHCAREEHAGRAAYHEGSKTYGHKVEGPCPCGVEHRPAPAKFGRLNGPPPSIDKLYTYRGHDETPRYQGVRFKDPKGFKQRPVDAQGNPGRSWSMRGVALVPYRLPELLAADLSSVVHIVEGEKDADRLASLGLVATTNIGGAEKWRPEYNPHFAGRNVVIIGDNDDPGRRHGHQVAKALDGIAASVKVLDLDGLPEKGDVSDWLNAGGTVEQLAELEAQAPEWSAPRAFRVIHADGRPKIVMESTDPSDGLGKWTAEALAALEIANTPPTLFQRAGKLARLRDGDDGDIAIEALSQDALRGVLDRAASWGEPRVNKKGGKFIRWGPPRIDVVRDFAALPG